MARQNVSTLLAQTRHQDERTAAALVVILRALADRYPTDMNLAMACKALAEFTTSLAQPTAAGEEPRG